MTPDWLVKLGIEKINAKNHDPDVSWLIEELSARLNLESEPSTSLPKIYREGMENIHCKQCKEKILPGQYFDFDSSGYSHYHLKDCYKYKRWLNDKTTAREVTGENTLDDSGDFDQTQQKAKKD